ncbi:hypothetical protein [Desulfosarcina variabilis]|uniref:hypothetical protein n=1 Tax=Desulfosarcina variabilis TaxID=2300 RepID=UPI003AFA3AC9
MYTRWWLIVLIWMVYLFDFWPFKRAWLNRTHPLIKGAILTFVSFVILYALIKGFFEGILSTIVYFITMHSHMGILYNPWQYFTSIAPPYWEQFAKTVSGNFHAS